MIKYRSVSWLVTVAISLLGVAAAQNSKVASSPPKSGSDPLRTATNPLTPKSAMPSQHKPAGASPKAAARPSNTSAELARLERQNSKAGSSKSSSPAPAKSTPAKSAATSGNGSKIDFKYQKPVGQKAATPGPGHTPNVTK
jgi:hypothetical protein